MREPRQVIADWYGDDRLAEIGDALIGALEAEGYRIVGEGQAVIGGEVVTLDETHPRVTGWLPANSRGVRKAITVRRFIAEVPTDG